VRRLTRIVIVLLIVVAAVWCAKGGDWLIVDQPQKADTIIVLAGEDHFRVQRALELLREGYAPHVIVDVESRVNVFQLSMPELARQFIATLPPQDAARVSVCPIMALSTKTETRDAETCLRQLGAHSVLIATSDFHSRRALLIFRHQLPQFSFSVAAARDAVEFGTPWWGQREWAKTFLVETTKLVWFEVVDRWRA
jgi:DUF218 domain